VVKIKFRPILAGFIVFMFLLSGAYATKQALYFSDVDVKVGSKTDKGLRNGELISEEAEPGDSVEFRVQVGNNYTSAENLKLQNIIVRATIESIDDGDDLEEESNEFDVSAGSNKRVTLKFQVPTEVDEDTYDVLIEAEGEDKNGTNQDISMKLKLEVNKVSHLIKITRAAVSPADVPCGKKNVQATVSLLNIGSEDEDNVKFELLNDDLNLDIKEDVGTLDADPFEETSKFSKTYSFSVPANIEEGSHPITFRALYDDDRKKSEQTVALNVNKCGADTGSNKVTEGTQNDVEVVTSGNTQGTSATLPEDTVVTSESFFSSNGFVIAVIIAEVIAVIVGIVLIVSLFARRD